ncbi:hypothetical protein [Paenibacillus timonensis]|uniref:hypothetical protein n=1 Tax=Paenibacillus timonensis TaxID=225915 RepID=UPI003F99A8FF
MKGKNLVLIFSGVFLLWAVSAVLIGLFVDVNYRGIAGDMFGAVNALFSGLAFAGLIYTIAIQRKELQEQQKAIKMQTEELSLQRRAIEIQNEELRMQREETARSADQLESQKNLMSLQIAMTTVNEMLKLKNKRIELIGYKLNGQVEKGLSAFTELVRRHYFEKFPITIDQAEFRSYFTSFFDILRYIHSSDLTPDQKMILANLLNIDTSDSEIFILYKAIENDQEKMMLLYMYGFKERSEIINLNRSANTF